MAADVRRRCVEGDEACQSRDVNYCTAVNKNTHIQTNEETQAKNPVRSSDAGKAKTSMLWVEGFNYKFLKPLT